MPFYFTLIVMFISFAFGIHFAFANDMVADAPPLAVVLSQLTDFVGTAPVLGHNVGFDLGFLRKQGALQMNSHIDTMDLAATVLPAAGR